MASSAIMHCRLYQPEWVNLSPAQGLLLRLTGSTKSCGALLLRGAGLDRDDDESIRPRSQMSFMIRFGFASTR
jgi:hypothetical protein